MTDSSDSSAGLYEYVIASVVTAQKGGRKEKNKESKEGQKEGGIVNKERRIKCKKEGRKCVI